MSQRINVKELTTFELKNIYDSCKEKISKMVADLDTILLCSEVEEELSKRK